MNDLDHWEARFAGDGYHFGTEPNAFLARQAPLLRPGMTTLSLADGEGRNGVWLAQQGLTVTSQDFSPRAQDKARALAADRGVSLRFDLADLKHYPFPEAEHDVVVGIFFQFLKPAERHAVWEGMIRVAKPGGLILIEGYGPRQIGYGTGGPKVPEQLYTAEVLREAFAACASVEVSDYDAEVDEGAGHKGMSHLIDLVARR